MAYVSLKGVTVFEANVTLKKLGMPPTKPLLYLFSKALLASSWLRSLVLAEEGKVMANFSSSSFFVCLLLIIDLLGLATKSLLLLFMAIILKSFENEASLRILRHFREDEQRCIFLVGGEIICEQCQ